MELTLHRKYKKSTYTIGILYVDGVKFSETIEDRDRGLLKSMPLDEIKKLKVYGETAIPAGRYEVILSYSPKFAKKTWAEPYGGQTPQLVSVPGYTGVRIHPMNTAEDSLGCIGPGRNTAKGKVTSSSLTYTKLMNEYLVPAFKKGERVYINIEM